MTLIGDDEPTTIHAGQARRLHFIHYSQSSDPDIVRIQSDENGEKKQSTSTSDA